MVVLAARSMPGTLGLAKRGCGAPVPINRDNLEDIKGVGPRLQVPRRVLHRAADRVWRRRLQRTRKGAAAAPAPLPPCPTHSHLRGRGCRSSARRSYADLELIASAETESSTSTAVLLRG